MRALAFDLLRHLGYALLVGLTITTLIFIIPYLAPGGAERALIGWPYSAERATALRAHYGFDRPLYVQYGRWLQHWITGDWGRSKFSGRSLKREVAYTLPLTLKLLAQTIALAVISGTLLALAATYPWDRPYGGRGQGLGTVAAGFPDFYFAILLKFFFVWHLEWFPVGGVVFLSERSWVTYRQLFLPALSVGLLYGLIISPRVAMRLAALTGAPEDGVMTTVHPRHGADWRLFGRALGHSLLLVLRAGALLFGSVILVERIFSIPGFGDFGIEAFVRRDYPKMQAFLLLTAGAYAVVRIVVSALEAIRERRRTHHATTLLEAPPQKSGADVTGLIMQDGFFLGAVLVLAIVATTLLAGEIAPSLPDEVHMKDRLQPPTTEYWMGSDLLGRDMLSRVIYGGRAALMVSSAGASGALLLGYLLARIARLAEPSGGGRLTPVICTLEAFPPLILGLVMMALLRQGYRQEIVALTAALAPPLAVTWLDGQAIPRSPLATSLGLVAAAWLKAMGLAIVLEATLNFLDIGLLPLVPSWGGDLKANLPYLHVNPAIVLFPGLAVVIAALGFNLMAASVQKHLRRRSPL